ncbi:hypothetical protein Aco04nite_70550 [Winogradskya consettensis]|uniref:Uncharacterized protein n=1 Tax=Winogradskya consettensis TaxID=113560 RepID=A0A919SYJ6_9ACTN|nr:hypothetical protein Aco04nite_70550 [Actinoplanes consettensis]
MAQVGGAAGCAVGEALCRQRDAAGLGDAEGFRNGHRRRRLAHGYDKTPRNPVVTLPRRAYIVDL